MSVISVAHLSKRFGDVVAVDDLSFEVEAGTITGFLGPNGAGKTTTLRLLLGLVHPTSGQALIDGMPYGALADPAGHVGAVLEASSFHPGRTARDHLRVRARPAGVARSRIEEVLDVVDLTDAADRKVGGFSLGMRQRLGLAGALLADPHVLILDEPTNGLDPAGIHWLRAFLRGHASAGGTVLVSSHQLAELSLSADQFVIINQGRFVTQGAVSEILPDEAVIVRTGQSGALIAALRARGIDAQATDDGDVRAIDTTTEQVGRAVAEAGIVVYEMRLARGDLETAFLDITTEDTAKRGVER